MALAGSRVYTFPLADGREETVCKKFFRDTLMISDGKIHATLLNKMKHSGPVKDQRGRHEPHNKSKAEDINFLCDFISMFPSYESHYSRNDNPHRKYLAPNLNMSIMYDLYKKHCTKENKTTLSLYMFRHIFSTRFNLHFHRPHTDTCQKCDS